MPTIITHTLVGCAAAASLDERLRVRKLWLLSIVVSILPDADVLGLILGVPYQNFFGHRGFFHSPFFALLLSLFIVALFFRDSRLFSNRWWSLTLYFWVVGASHGLLDAMTDGGYGIALLTPFDNGRHFLPWTPIKVSPLGIQAFFSEWGLNVLLSELLWIWLPLGGAIAGWILVRRLMSR